MHLYLALLFHRDYFDRLNASLSGFSIPQGLFRPPGFISIWLFYPTGIISAVQIHLYLAFLFHRDYFGRLDSSLSGSFVPQRLFQPPGFISIWLFCSTGIILPRSNASLSGFSGIQLACKFYFPHSFRTNSRHKKAGNLENTRFPASGDDGDRTRDLQIANLALSQLSYIPLFTNNDEYSTIVRKMSTQEFR